MELTETVVAALAIGAAVAAVAAAALALLAVVRARQVRRAYAVFSRGSREDIIELLKRHIEDVDQLRAEVAALDQRSGALRDQLAAAVSRVATVRYDAFDEIGGRLSYSTALLDDHGDGVVLTSIHGRHDCRSYAKPVTGGESPHTLSDEEISVLRDAVARDPLTRTADANGQRAAQS